MRNRWFYVNPYFGRAVCFANGFSIGFNWMHGNGESSKTSAVLAGYHPPSSITWLWSLSWSKPAKLLCLPAIGGRRSGYGWAWLRLPLVGTFSFHWQPRMPK